MKTADLLKSILLLLSSFIFACSIVALYHALNDDLHWTINLMLGYTFVVSFQQLLRGGKR